MHGRVNHVAIEEAHDAPDVVLGMFFANSHPATVYSILELRILSYHLSL